YPKLRTLPMTKRDTCSTLPPREPRTSCGCRAAAARVSYSPKNCATGDTERPRRSGPLAAAVTSLGLWGALALGAAACAPATPAKTVGVSDAPVEAAGGPEPREPAPPPPAP